MNLKLKLMSCCVAAFLLSGCSTFHADTASTPLNVNLMSDKIVDVEVKNKVSAQSGATVLLGIFTFQDDNHFADGITYNGVGASSFVSLFDATSKAKSAAGYKAMKQSNADVLLSPTYEVVEHNYLLWKNIKVKVDAFPGKIVGFKNKQAPKEKGCNKSGCCGYCQ